MQNNFCKSLSNAISFRIPGETDALTFNPCCLYDDYLPYHAPFFPRQRKQFIEAVDFLPGCSKCKLKEQTDGTSLRKKINTQIPDGIADTIYKLEIVLDTTCNAACVQCGTLQSSLWRKELADDKKIFHIQPKTQIDDRIKEIKNNIDFNKVKMYHFWGGEPLLTDTHLKFLYEIDDPSTVTIMYTTNGSIFPDEKTLELWSKFKAVTVNISIDAIEDKFYYIRWPLRWEKVTRNLERFKTESPPNVRFHVNCCIIPLNVYYVDELGYWLGNNFKTASNGSDISYNFIRGEGTLDIAATPMKLREEIWKKLGEDHVVSNVLKEVPVLDTKPMLDHLGAIDARRNLNWRDTFKEIVKFYD
jgi:sulfatase maturation enzyme AslB (radical SAM superfamily)